MGFIRKLLADRSGNFGLLTAIMLVPIVGCAGLAIDFSAANDVKAELQGAADAAAVGAIAKGSPAMKDSSGLYSGAIASGEDTAKTLFAANLSGSSKADLSDISATVTKKGAELDSVVTFAADVPMKFMQIFGVNTFHVAGSATAKIRTSTFMDFYLLLDNTPSMGIGATSQDIDKMVSTTGCAFACHVDDPNNAAAASSSDNTYPTAKVNNVEMRIDVVRAATKDLFDTAQGMNSDAGQDLYRMALYTFGTAAQSLPASGIDQISALSSDLAQARTNADAVDLMTIPYQNYNDDQQTSFEKALTGLGSVIGTSAGDGSTAQSPQKIVFFVSDGVGDSAKSSGCTEPLASGTRCQEPIDVKYCDGLKAKGIQIAILYTTYLPITSNDWYNSWIAPFQSQIGTRMQACASPGFYFEVSPTQGISDAMQALFQKVISNPRITS